MAKKRAIIVTQPDAPEGAEVTAARGSIVMVKYIGPNRAVLAGRMILHGETRLITALQYAQAERQRPGEWELPEQGKQDAAPEGG